MKAYKMENKRITLGNYPIRVIVDPDWEKLRTFWDVYPSWQNSIDSISSVRNSFETLGIFKGDNIVGYAVYSKKSGYMPQFGIDKKYRRKGMFTALLQRVLKEIERDTIAFHNICSSCDSFSKFTRSVNIAPTLSQHEMTLTMNTHGDSSDCLTTGE